MLILIACPSFRSLKKIKIYNKNRNKIINFAPYFKWLYFNFVAIPPLMCLSALFSSKIILTCFAKLGFIFFNLSDTSLCTVLLEIPELFCGSSYRIFRIYNIMCKFYCTLIYWYTFHIVKPPYEYFCLIVFAWGLY